MKTTPEALSHHKRPKHCFHQIVNSKIVKILIYTVNYCYFVCEWDIIYLLYKWSIFVVVFNVSWLQNKHCMHVSYTCVVLTLLFSSAPAVQFISSSNSISDTRAAAKHMGCKYQIKLIPFSPFPFEVFLCFVCENLKVQCDFLKSTCLDWIQARDMCTGLRLFFHEAQNLSDMRNDSQIVWRCMRKSEDLECHVWAIGATVGWGQACNLHILEGTAGVQLYNWKHTARKKNPKTKPNTEGRLISWNTCDIYSIDFLIHERCFCFPFIIAHFETA